MKHTILLASGLAIGASSILLFRAFHKPTPVDKTVAEKHKKRNKIIGFSVLGAGLILVGVAIKMKAFAK